MSPRAGDRIDDYCRVCKAERSHAVVAAGSDGVPVRVVCGYCGSQHNYRGPRASRGGGSTDRSSPSREASSDPQSRSDPFPIVGERERRYRIMSQDETAGSAIDIETLLRRVLREELGLGPVVPADKWRGGELVLRPGREGLQEKSWPIEAFFHKIVMLRNRLRVLEQQVNASALPADEKIKLQGYVTACYGSLTSFNILFADDADKFKGAGGGDD